MWDIDSGPIDPKHHLGETVANGMIGITSTGIPFRTERALVNGACEILWPGSVSSIPTVVEFLNLGFSVDGVRSERLADAVRKSTQVTKTSEADDDWLLIFENDLKHHAFG